MTDADRTRTTEKAQAMSTEELEVVIREVPADMLCDELKRRIKEFEGVKLKIACLAESL